MSIMLAGSTEAGCCSLMSPDGEVISLLLHGARAGVIITDVGLEED